MKIRHGFVSNSSSSSYIVVLPENFDIEKFIASNFTPDEEAGCLIHYKTHLVVQHDLVSVLKQLKAGGEIAECSDEGGEIYDSLCDLLSPFMIADVYGGPDSGGIQGITFKDYETKFKFIQGYQP